jgi:hypothetical protein
MRNLSTSGHFYCLNESCRTQFVKIISKVDWVERRIRLEDNRRKQLEKAIGVPV